MNKTIKMSCAERQYELDQKQINLQQKKIAATSLLRKIKEEEKALVIEQESLWNEQELPILALLENIEKKEKEAAESEEV